MTERKRFANASFLVFAVLLTMGEARGHAAQAKIGGKAPTFEAKDSSGKAVSLSATLGKSKVVVVDFWSARCPVSEKYEPVLKKLAADYEKKGVVVLAVNSNFNESVEDIEKVRAARGVPYRVLVDAAEGKIAKLYGASKTPEAYVVDSAGNLVYHGNLDEIGPALDAVLAGKPVAKAESKAFGCSIKRP